MITLTVYFEAPFWVGIFEEAEHGRLRVCKVVFGSEPRDCDIYRLILEDFYSLKFSRSVDAEQRHIKKPSPKRMNRQIAKTLNISGVSTKSQQAVALAREEHKKEKRKISKDERAAREEELFHRKQLKKKEKKKGR